eukprot:987680_1
MEYATTKMFMPFRQQQGHEPARYPDYGYIVIFKVIPNSEEEYLRPLITEFKASLPLKYENETKIIARKGWNKGKIIAAMQSEGNGFNISTHPDSYVLTEHFQKKHTVQILR